MRNLIAALCLLALTSPAFAQTEGAASAMIPRSFADLAARVQDAVVNVSTTQKVEKRRVMRPTQRMAPVPMPQFPPGSPFQDFFEEFFNNPNGFPQPDMNDQDMGPSPRAQSLGSGFVIDAEKGLVVTNNHVISDADEIKIILHDNTQLDAEVLGRDTETDLALLKVKTTKPLRAVNWGNSDAMRVGDWILAVGNPFGLGGTVTSGIVSARQRNINAGRYDDFIQTDASINRGNSGGPMFNLNGEVIGINTAIFSPTGGSVGIGFAIPSNLAKPVIDQLIKFGKTTRGWIGVKIQDVTPEIAESMGIDSSTGALIASVTPDGPAAKAGIKQGDIITSFNGVDVTQMRHLPRVVADTPVGKEVPIAVLRQGKEMTLTIRTGQLETAMENGLLDDEKPVEKAEKTDKGQMTEIPELSLHVASLTPELRQRYRLDDAMTGVVVTRVARDADAAEKGLRPGDVLLEINQRTVKLPSDIQTSVQKAAADKKTSVLLLVNAQNNLRFVAVKLVKPEKKADKAKD